MTQAIGSPSYIDKIGSLSLPDTRGVFISLVIMGTWLWHLTTILLGDVSATCPLSLCAAILLQTFLNTGLFVTAHDAIHGLVFPANRTINAFVGRLCAMAYAALSYRILTTNHWLHHCNPLSVSDPDFYGKKKKTFLGWYLLFMGAYCRWAQLICLISALLVMIFWFQVSLANLLLLWALPLLLSSLQLFYFGTYRPHGAIDDPSRFCAKSDDLPWLLSLLTCYHFGYHQEHHDNPNTPWWALPALYKHR